jgi:hypothetical protein
MSGDLTLRGVIALVTAYSCACWLRSRRPWAMAAASSLLDCDQQGVGVHTKAAMDAWQHAQYEVVGRLFLRRKPID